MSHTEIKEVTYLNGHRIKVNGLFYIMERACRAVRVQEVDEARADKRAWPVCSQCGGAINSSDPYCRHCGARVVNCHADE